MASAWWGAVVLAASLSHLPFRASAAVQGSLDACSEGEVAWTDVKHAVFGYLSGRVTADRISNLRGLALKGGLDPQNCDCWYGWITLRLFSLLVLSPAERSVVLSEQLFHTEWVLWLGAPWVEMLDSPWDVPTVLAAAAYAHEEPTEAADCEPQLLEQVQREGLAAGAEPSAALADLAAALLMRMPEDLAWGEPCGGLAAATAALALGLAPHGHRVTPGYALRVTQRAMQSAGHAGLQAFLSSPWPVAQLLPRLVYRVRAGRERGVELAEDGLTEKVVEASRAEFPGLQASFLPPVTRQERLRLREALSATHAALSLARVPYFAITGTLLGSMRHHGFVPWDGDADVCVDIRDEQRLLRLALDSGDGAVGRAAALLRTSGFELFANAERPLTFKLSGRSFPRVPGRAYGYPYVDVWFCHGWAEGDFSLQSAGFGVPMPRELVFPRRKVLFAGLALWAFGEPRASLTKYYGEGDWFSLCVGHATFHRQERKFADSESERFDGRAPCSRLAPHFAFASSLEPGLPAGVDAAALLPALAAWLQHQPEPRWAPDPDGPQTGGMDDAWRELRDVMAEPMQLGPVSIGELQSAGTSRLVARGAELLHLLTEAQVEMRRPQSGRCDFLLRWRPLGANADTQLMAAADSASVMLVEVENADGGAFRLDVPSCICRHRAGGLAMQWVAEDLW